MFMTSETLVVTPGRRKEALDRIDWMHGLMQEAAGFCRAIAAKYLGDATRFAVLRCFDDEEAYSRFHDGFMSRHAPSRPAGLYAIEETGAWNAVTDVPGDSVGDFLVIVRREVPEDAWQEHVEHTREVTSMALTLGGVVRQTSFRSREGNQALTVRRFRAREDFDRFLRGAGAS